MPRLRDLVETGAPEYHNEHDEDHTSSCDVESGLVVGVPATGSFDRGGGL